ncbi:hypothetical protein [Streptomyces sp. NPDC051994]|uniref:hypothetical protein n=1 Tax=unclassified Streptomyces TaxID=2593676 RepID=UPI003421BF86
MIRETYKGRQLKAIKGKIYGKSRITVNGTECGEWLGTQADVIEWAKRTINDVDSRPFEGRWSECWYAPGTYELNEIGHVTAPGGTCSCDLCKTEPWNSCRNITAGGVCVCHYCMKPYLADSTEKAEETAEEVADSAEEVQAAASETLMRRAAKVTPERLEIVEEQTDTDVLKAFETKADEIAKANGWTLAHTETVMLRFLRDSSPAEAVTIAAALQTRHQLSAEPNPGPTEYNGLQRIANLIQ